MQKISLPSLFYGNPKTQALYFPHKQL